MRLHGGDCVVSVVRRQARDRVFHGGPHAEPGLPTGKTYDVGRAGLYGRPCLSE